MVHIKHRAFALMMSLVMVFTMMPMLSGGVYATGVTYSVTLPSDSDVEEGHFTYFVNNCDSDNDGYVQYFNEADIARNASIEFKINEYVYAFGKDFAVKAGGVALTPYNFNKEQGQAYYKLDPSLDGKTITVEGIVPLLKLYGDNDGEKPYQVLVNEKTDDEIPQGDDVNIRVIVNSEFKVDDDFAVYFKGTKLTGFTQDPSDEKQYTYTMLDVTERFNYTDFIVTGILDKDDNRAPIKAYEVTISEDYYNPSLIKFFEEPVLGEDVVGMTNVTSSTGINVSKGLPAYLCDLTWRKYNEDTGKWEQKGSEDIFSEGKYRIEGRVRADEWTPEPELNGNSHYVADSCTVTVNGETWNTDYYSRRRVYGSNQISEKLIWSKEYVLVNDGTTPLSANEFTLGYDNKYLSANKAISEVDISNKVVGGKSPYTFTKKSGPEWINVSIDGKVTGTPKAKAGESQLVVEVTDSSSPAKSAEMNCSVGSVGIDLADRIQVHEVVINDHRFNRPRCNTVASGMFEVGILPDEDGKYNHPARMNNNTWRYDDGSTYWYQISGSEHHEFSEDKDYRIDTSLRIDEESVTDPYGNEINCLTHVLADDCKLIVNGVEWERNGSGVHVNTTGLPYSQGSFHSPTMTVEHRIESPITNTVTKVATVDEDGSLTREYQPCLDCHETKDPETFVIKYIPAKKATTTEDGIKAHYEIVETDEWYADENCTEFIEHHNEYIIPRVSSISLSAANYTYNGYVKTPALTIKDSTGAILRNGVDYTYTMSSGRKNVGTYYYNVTLKDNYSGYHKLSFKINPKGSTIKSPYRYKGAIRARWYKQSSKMAKSRIYGYQIAYATKSDFSNAKYAYSNKYKYTSKKISKLKRKTYYYVKVRTRMKVGGVWHYSGWSKVKKVKTK